MNTENNICDIMKTEKKSFWSNRTPYYGKRCQTHEAGDAEGVEKAMIT